MIPQVFIKLELDGPPTCEEIKKATMQLQVGKSLGIDGIPAEVCQHRGAMLSKLQDLFTNYWEKETLLQDFKDAVIVSRYKTKGEKSACSKYQGILLLSIAGNILAYVTAEQAYSNDSTGKHSRKSVLVQVQQRGDS